jgi:hypothetical protein
MMEWNYLSNVYNDRIKIWRNTIQLFYEYKKPKFRGPFKELGYKMIVEPNFLDKKNGYSVDPDIVASSPSGWVIVEITLNNGSKEEKLKKYKKIDPRDLSTYGLTKHSTQCDIITSRLSYINDGDNCQIIVDSALDVKKDNYLSNNSLRTTLMKSIGIQLNNLPELSICLLPEMSDQSEIRSGLLPSVMQIFNPACEGKTIVDMVDEGLDKIKDSIEPNRRKSLITKSSSAMEDLRVNYLPNYLIMGDGVYKRSPKFKIHHKTMKSITLILQKWVGVAKQSTLDDY